MHRLILTVLFWGILGRLGAQPQAPAVPVRAGAAVVLPAGLQMLPLTINSSFPESAPLISADGNLLYFSRTRHSQNFGPDKAEDIWVSKRNAAGAWSRPVNVGAPLNNTYDNVAVALDPSCQIIYLLNSYDEQGEGLAWSEMDGRSWTHPQACTIDDFYTIGDGATFHLGANGNALIMGLERREGLGRRDLYVSFRLGEFHWSAPRHLGNTINTPKEEARAFLAADGRTLYFAGRGHGGYGGYDLFCSRRLDDSWTNWSEPENLGEGINTPFDDEYISLPAIGDPVYLVYKDSNSHNIYTAHLPDHVKPQPVTLVYGKVTPPEDGSLEQLQVTSLDLTARRRPRSLPLSHDGTFTLVVPPGEEMGVQVAAPGYLPYSTYLPDRTGTRPGSADTDQGVLLAATDFSPEYLKRDGEISKLRLRLDQVDEEMAEMLRQREAYLQELKQLEPGQEKILYSDPELDALRHRFEVLNRPVVIDTVPKTKKGAEEESLIPEKDARRGVPDDELADMKRRFSQFYLSEQGTEQNQEKGEFLWNEARGFADFQEEVRDRMLQEMRPVVSRELTRKLWPQVKASVAESLHSGSMMILDEKEYEIREQIAQQLEDAAIHVGQSRIEMPAWQQELEGELRTELEAEVRTALENELQDDLRAALANEALYQLRRREAEALDRELQEKITLQVQEEREKTLAAVALQERDLSVKGGEAQPSVYAEENRELVLLRPEKGAVFPLNNVFFKPNSDQLKDISMIELDRIVEFLTTHPKTRVEIAAHTNGWLSHSLSLQLSGQRARAVAEYLFSQGIPPGQVEHQGYGKTSPIASNDTLEGRRKNQRVELHILEN